MAAKRKEIYNYDVTVSLLHATERGSKISCLAGPMGDLWDGVESKGRAGERIPVGDRLIH
jgi:hypothetical protein